MNEQRCVTPALLRGGLKWLFAAWLAATLLFAHGCHGDEDHELFGARAGSLSDGLLAIVHTSGSLLTSDRER
jgi:hypothetical protein